MERRFGRHLVAALTLALAFALIPSASALAAAQYYLSGSEPSASDDTYAEVYGTSGEVPGPMRLRILRNGAEIENKAGEYEVYSGGANGYSYVESPVDLAPGDVVEIFNPGSSGTPARSHTWSGRPTLDSCPVGSDKLAGKADPGTEFFFVGAFRPGADPYDPNAFNEATVVQTGEDWLGTLERGLAPGDIVVLSGGRQVDPEFFVQRSDRAEAGTCAVQPLPAPPTTPITPPVVTPGTPLDGAVDPLGSGDVKQKGNKRVRVRVSCLAASTIPCRGTIGIQTTKRFAKPSAVASQKKKKAKKKRVTLATKKLAPLAPGRTRTVTVKLKRSSVKLLRRQRKLKVRVSVVTRDAANKRVVSTRTVTLKYKKPKKKKKN